MINLKPLLVAASLLLLNNSFVLADNHGGADKVSKALAEANNQYKMALKSGFAWTTTEKVLSKAKKAMKKGDMKLAMKLTSKALAEAKGSLAQAKESKEHWQDYIPKK